MKTYLFTKRLVLIALPISSLFFHDFSWAGSTGDKIKEGIESIADALKNATDKVGEEIEALQHYFDEYSWQGIIQDRATSGLATLSDLKFNGHKRVIVVRPGERIEGEAQCSLDKEQCSNFGFYRVVVGIKGNGGQTTFCNCFGAFADEHQEKFTLIAPSEEGIYQIRFRSVERLFESDALEDWTNDKGQEPDAKTTIGIIVVKA